MNNLSRVLTENGSSALSPDVDLKLLVTAIKEGRKHITDAKLLDPFYESLEGLLTDLRTVTMDNRDAEAFLKPVSKSDVPDYYEVITNPMDLQTMMKKVKQKQYKSKLEFRDDLELIWSNCLTYNDNEHHPLRGCAMRLKAKAEQMLKNITDVKERQELPLPAIFDGSRQKPAMQKSVTKHATSSLAVQKLLSGDVAFHDMPAIMRTPEGMAEFYRLQHELNADSASHDQLVQDLRDRIHEEDDQESEGDTPELLFADGEIGRKRKINKIVDHHVRKRARTTSQLSSDEEDETDLWWRVVQEDSMLGNGIPPTISSLDFEETPAVQPFSVRFKKKQTKAPPKSLLFHLTSNMRTLRRVRRTHAKFAALNQVASLDENEAGISLSGVGDDVNERVDERPWRVTKGVSGIELGRERATDCLKWMGGKILEHAGFQGTSRAALDVLAGVAGEYLLNVGQTIRFLCDKYAQKMTPEEIILHTLFESGISKMQDLSRYIKDDIIRYGYRLGELEKKLVTAYENATSVEVPDDENLFNNGDNEDDGAFALGNFADAFGEDFLGLRELGIASEFNLSSLSVPKKLLKGHNKAQNHLPSAAAKPTEAPLRYPPPPSFEPLSPGKVEEQIGLLRPYYQNRLATLAASIVTLQPGPPSFSTAGSLTGTVVPARSSAMPAPPADLVLPDDQLPQAQTKMGPLGHINKPGPTTGAGKKKGKGKEGTASEAGKKKKAK